MYIECFSGLVFESCATSLSSSYDKLCFYNNYTFSYFKYKYILYNIPVTQLSKTRPEKHSIYTASLYNIPRFFHRSYELFKTREIYDLYINHSLSSTTFLFDIYSKKYNYAMFLKSIVGLF